MRGAFLLKLIAWAIAITLVALPIVGVLNGWFASDRWPVTKLDVRAEFNHVSAEQIRAAVAPHLGEGFFAVNLEDVRAAVAKLPWVERAEARKRWPDSIELVVFEQQHEPLHAAIAPGEVGREIRRESAYREQQGRVLLHFVRQFDANVERVRRAVVAELLGRMAEQTVEMVEQARSETAAQAVARQCKHLPQLAQPDVMQSGAGIVRQDRVTHGHAVECMAQLIEMEESDPVAHAGENARRARRGGECDPVLEAE